VNVLCLQSRGNLSVVFALSPSLNTSTFFENLKHSAALSSWPNLRCRRKGTQ